MDLQRYIEFGREGSFAHSYQLDKRQMRSTGA